MRDLPWWYARRESTGNLANRATDKRNNHNVYDHYNGYHDDYNKHDHYNHHHHTDSWSGRLDQLRQNVCDAEFCSSWGPRLTCH
jgi:hypothetical protein